MRSTIARVINVLTIALTSFVVPVAVSAPASAQTSFLHAAAGSVVDQTGLSVPLHCVNLSPWLVPEGYLIGSSSLAALTTSPSQVKQRLVGLVGSVQADQFWRDWASAFVQESDFAALSAAGFDCVRLPLNASYIAHFGSDDSATLDPEGLAPVDDAVQWGARHGLYVMLDLHDAPGGQDSLSTVSDVPSNNRTPQLWTGTQAASNQRRTVNLWRALAQRYADATSVGGYDLLNEPALPNGVPATALSDLYQRITEVIRSVDPSHMVILEGNNYAKDFSILRTPPDRNSLFEFHAYASWGSVWNNPSSSALAPMLALRASTGLPVWLGEFGENSLAWQAQMVDLLKANGIGWAIWPWKRFQTSADHPVIQTIHMPAAWQPVDNYLVGKLFAPRPSVATAQLGMSAVLNAIRTDECTTDEGLIRVLAGR